MTRSRASRFPNNRIPADRIDPYAANIIALVPLPNQAGANNFFRTAELVDNADRLLSRVDWRPNTTDSIFGRYMYSNRTREIPGAFGGVVDGTGTSAFGNQEMKTHAFVGGWTRILSSTIVNEFRLSWSRANSTAVHQAFGIAPPANATIPGSITDPLVAGGFPGITIDGYFGGVRPRPHRVAGLPAEVPAHGPVRVHQHHVVAEGRPRVQVRRRHHRADEERVPGRARHARRHPLPQLVHRQPDGRLPARLRLGLPAVERVGGGPAPLGHVVLLPGRLEGHRQAVAEPRPALRLHHAGARGQQRADQLHPGGRRQPGLRERRLARGARAW